MKYTAFREGERWLGGKDLERHPLIVRIQGRQDYKNIPFPFYADSLYPKNPLTKSLETDCLSSQTLDCDTVSKGGVREDFYNNCHGTFSFTNCPENEKLKQEVRETLGRQRSKYRGPPRGCFFFPRPERSGEEYGDTNDPDASQADGRFN